MQTLLDRRSWIYHLFITATVAALLTAEDFFEGQKLAWEIILIEVLVYFMVISVVSFVSLVIVRTLNRLMPWEEALFKRFLTESIIMVVMILILTILGSISNNILNAYERVSEVDDDMGFEFLALVMFSITVFMVFAFHEFIILSSDKESLKFKAEVLQKQSYLAKYEALKSQINPHFLFNSLNVLSSLIYRDTQKSDQFIKKFAEVYRYVLELNQEKLVPIKKELNFLESYLFLQKIRYGDHLEIHQHISSEILNKFIPPLSLQLVIENALKHNVISEDLKLHIYLENTDDEIIVRNNYQYRDSIATSTGIGQKNLSEKYSLLAEKLPKFYVENGFYFTRLPILPNAMWNEH
jgi:sensor histidine kinase YesM